MAHCLKLQGPRYSLDVTNALYLPRPTHCTFISVLRRYFYHVFMFVCAHEVPLLCN